ncbi:MAG: LysR family transcriptional regulator [Oscillospiraceae bacterium]|nr:LysR family transcriptional regulator [Oscillospiraceae bacterium]
MRLQQLQCILEVEKHGSISAAARAMYLGQTTLSAAVRKLEEELGVCIFERNANGVEPTLEGKQVLEIAARICRNYDQIQRIGYEQETTDSVTIYVSTGVEMFLPSVLEERLPLDGASCLLRFQKTKNLALSQYIMNDECDIAVSHISAPNLKQLEKVAEKYNMQIKKLTSDRLYAVVRPDHPLADRTAITVQEMRHMKIAGLQQYRDSVSSLAFEPRMGYTNRYTTLPNIGLLLKAVEEQNMVAIVSGYALAYENKKRKMKLHPIYLTDSERSNEIALYVLFRNSWAQTNMGKIILDCIQRSFRDLTADPCI